VDDVPEKQASPIIRRMSSPSCLVATNGRTRSGKPCRSPAVRGKRRCRMHGGAAGSGGSDRRRVDLIGSALVQRGGNRACLGPGEPYHGMEPIGFYWSGVLGVDPGASPLPRAGNRKSGRIDNQPQTGMQLYDTEGRRLYFTEEERRAFVAAAAKVARQCRQGGHQPSPRHETDYHTLPGPSAPQP